MAQSQLSSVSTSLLSARNTPLFYYEPQVSVGAWCRLTGTTPAAFFSINNRCRAAIYLVLLWGMRASEYLNATVDDLLGNDFILIRGLKKSASYRINLPGIDSQVAYWLPFSPGRAVAGVTYLQIYASCVRCRIGTLITGHKNLSRTHSGRYKIAEISAKRGERIVGDLLHHRSTTSANFYSGAKGVSYG